MTEKINSETKFIIKIYTFEYYVKFSFWVSVEQKFDSQLKSHITTVKIYLLLKAIFTSAAAASVNITFWVDKSIYYITYK